MAEKKEKPKYIVVKPKPYIRKTTNTKKKKNSEGDLGFMSGLGFLSGK